MIVPAAAANVGARTFLKFKVGTMNKKLAMALVPLLAVGCGDELVDENKDGIADGINQPGSVTVVAPATPVGTVGGQVLSSRYLPMDGVDVTMTIGGAMLGSKAVTDATGSFSFKDVPAGSRVLLTFSKAGFVTARATAVIPSQAGNVPINNANANFGPVMMAETSGSVKFQVFTPNSRPAVGAKATLHVSQAAYLLSSSAESIEGQVVVQGEVDAQGILSFSGIPAPEEGSRIGTNYQLVISPLDTDNDGIPDVDGWVRNYSGQTLVTGDGVGVYEALSIQLTTSIPNAGLAVKYSNLGAIRTGDVTPLKNMVRPGEPVTIVFNKPIQPNSLIVTLTDEYGKESLSVSKSLSNGNTYLSITPGASVSAGKELNLYFRAVASSDGTVVGNQGYPFVVGDVNNPPSVGVELLRYQELNVNNAGSNLGNNGTLDSGETVQVNFNQVMGYLNNGTVQVFFDLDLNANGSVGDAQGEKGFAIGFPLNAMEPSMPIQTRIPAEQPVFTLVNSGYTTRYSFTFFGNKLVAGVATPHQIPANQLPPITLRFTALQPVAIPHYQSAWGVPQMTDLVLPTTASAIVIPTVQ